MDPKVYDYVIIGSGFGGCVSAMRLAEKGYSVLILEKGKRYRDEDFPTTNLKFWKFLWLPTLRSFGILQISLLQGVMVLHGVGVGGGSLGYANVLEVPPTETFASPAWNEPLPWGKVLAPFFEVARHMLGDFEGYLQTDGYEVYNGIAREHDLVHLGCWAHCRRYFVEAEAVIPPCVTIVVASIGSETWGR